MPAYVIVELEITDPAGYEEYKKLVPPTLAAYDGKFVVRGGACETLEGDWRPQRIVVLEFPTPGRARQWWASREYAQAKALRLRTARSKLIVVEGVV